AKSIDGDGVARPLQVQASATRADRRSPRHPRKRTKRPRGAPTLHPEARADRSGVHEEVARVASRDCVARGVAAQARRQGAFSTLKALFMI
ncbi:unnamed protein product, partial [Musa banksii]